jgi:hypothetical protein
MPPLPLHKTLLSVHTAALEKNVTFEMYKFANELNHTPPSLPAIELRIEVLDNNKDEPFCTCSISRTRKSTTIFSSIQLKITIGKRR